MAQLGQDVPDSMRVASDSVFYSVKPLAKRGYSDRNFVQPITGSSSTVGSRIQINIPVGQPAQWLNPTMSYLQFTINNTAAANTQGFRIDSTAHSFIQRLRVSNAGVLLADVDNYGPLVACLHDSQSDPMYAKTLAFQGRASSAVSIMGGMPALAVANNAATYNGASAVADARLGIRINHGASETVTIPLIAAGPLASSQTKYIPLWALNAPLVLELFLVSDVNTPVVGFLETTAGAYTVSSETAALSWTITDMRYYYQTTTLYQDVVDAVQQFRAQTGGLITIASHNWFNTSYAIPVDTGVFSCVVPYQYTSLESILFFFRDTAGAARNAFTMSRCSDGITQFQFTVGGKPVYSTPIDSYAQMHSELRKVFHAYSDTNSLMCTDSEGYSDNNYGNSGSFATGVDLSRFSHKTDVLDSGIDTRNQTIYFKATLGGANVCPASQLDMFAHFGVRYVIDQTGNMRLVW